MTPLAAYHGLLRHAARQAVRRGVTPNQVTYLGLGVSVAGAGMLALAHAPFAAALGLLVGGWLDALDGEVARCSGRASKFGGYLDAICDRVSDTASLLALAIVTKASALAVLATASSSWVSYAKARAAIEMPISNHDWPSLMGREARILLVSAGLVLWGSKPEWSVRGWSSIEIVLAALTLGALHTALLRYQQASHALRAADDAAGTIAASLEQPPALRVGDA